jgi:fructosamine-3-kinase
MAHPDNVPRGTGVFVRDGEQLFAKVAGLDDAARLHAEALGLTALRKTATVRVPELAGQGRDDERNWLLLEWLDLQPLDAASGAALGAELAALHRVPATGSRSGATSAWWLSCASPRAIACPRA